MEYIESINIFGKEYKPNSCIILESRPTTDTPGLVGMLAMDTSSENKDLYKCISVDDENYQWVTLGSGSGNNSAKVVEDLDSIEEPDEFTDYYVKSGSKYLHYRWSKELDDFIMIGTDTYSREEIDELNSSIVALGTKVADSETAVKILQNDVKDLKDKTQGITEFPDYTLGQGEGERKNTIYLYKNGLVQSSVTVEGGSGGTTEVQSKISLNYHSDTPRNYSIQKNQPIIVKFYYSSEDKEKPDTYYEAIYRVRKGKGSTVLKQGDLSAPLEGQSNFLAEIDVTDIVGNESCTIYVQVEDELGTISTISWSIKVIDISFTLNFNDKATYTTDQKIKGSFLGGTNKIVNWNLKYTDGDIEIKEPIVVGSGDTFELNVPAILHGTCRLECQGQTEINGTTIYTETIYRDIIFYDKTNETPLIGCIYRDRTITVKEYDTLSIPYYVVDSTTNYPTVIKKVKKVGADGEVDEVETSSDTVDKRENGWDYQPTQKGDYILSILCEQTEISFTVKVEELDIDVDPVDPIENKLALDFNPVGLNNNSANRIWSNGTYNMIVSEKFDWDNGGYGKDENEDSYFLIKAGSYIDFDYQMFKSDFFFGDDNNVDYGQGQEMKIIFKTENVRSADAVWLSNVEEQTVGGIQKDIGLQLGVHDGWIKNASNVEDNTIAASNTYLYMSYSEEDIIELDINIEGEKSVPENENRDPFLTYYEDGVPSKAFIYKDAKDFIQKEPKFIRIGSDNCDVKIYRLKLYTKSLKTEGILRNYIADARNTSEMISRYNRNSIYYNATTEKYSPYKTSGYALNPEKLAALIPDVKVLILTTPHFTTSKKTFEKCTLQCIHAPGGKIYPSRGNEDNWLFENGYHSGQGTTSDNYGISGRNVDFLFNCDGVHKPSDKVSAEENYKSKVTTGCKPYGTLEVTTEVKDWMGDEGKVSLTKDSVPNNFFNFKVNVASSENVNNALLQKRYDDFLPYVPLSKKRDPKIKTDMEFVPAILFIKEEAETGHTEFKDSNLHFYAVGNLGDSKKTDYTRAYDPNDMNEFTIEVSDNNKNNATFQTGVYLENGETKIETAETAGIHQFIYPIPKDSWNTNNYRYQTLYTEGFDGDHSFEPRYACCGNYRDGKLVNGDKTIYEPQINKNNNVWRAFYRWVITSSDDEFVQELKEWCVPEAVNYFYAFTHIYTMIDNRAKNTFWHFAKTGTYQQVSKPVEELMHIYCELIDGNYVDTEDTTPQEDKIYYTQYAFDFWDYDNDTALGINNDGELIFPYGKEDIDKDRDAGDGAYLFNGAQSTFWLRVRKLLGDGFDMENPIINNKVSETVAKLNTKAFNAEDLIQEFDKVQSCFPEEIWRLDIERKYIRPYLGISIDNSIEKQDPQYLRDKMQGRKKYQRRQWIRDQEFYFGTKYGFGNAITDNNTIAWRGPSPDGANFNVSITPYSDLYIRTNYGTGTTKLVRAKAGETKTIESPVSDMTDTYLYVRGSNKISSIGDISKHYFNYITVAHGEKLKDLILCSKESGVVNRYLKSFSLGTNPILEKLDISNCIELTGTIDLSKFSNFSELQAENSKINSVLFAPNGAVKTAILPDTLTSLTLINLNNLNLYDEQTKKGLKLAENTNLSSLTMQGGVIESYDLVENYKDSLQYLDLKDINWTLESSEIFERLLPITEGGTMIVSKLTGQVTITGDYLLKDINKYMRVWPDLEFILEKESRKVTYKNVDGTILYEAFVAHGSNAIDPVSLGEIETPSRGDTEKYKYTFVGWTIGDILIPRDDYPIREDTVLTAFYSTTLQEYTVKWMSETQDEPILVVENLPYGSSVDFDTELKNQQKIFEKSLLSQDLLTGGYIGKLFTGWDKSTSFITRDTSDTASENFNEIIVNAKWQEGNTAEIGTKTLNELTPAQIYAAAKSKTVRSFRPNDYFETLLGNEFDYDNIQSDTMVSINDTKFFRYSGREINNQQPITTAVTPLKEISSFTLAIDFEFTSFDQAGLLLNCYAEDNRSSILSISCPSASSGSPLLSLSFGGKTTSLVRAKDRQVIVLRYVKENEDGTAGNVLYVYTSKNVDAFENGNEIGRFSISGIDLSTLQSDNPITLGGADSTSYRVNANVYWCKMWYEDLGIDDCLKMAQNPREILRMRYCGTERYSIFNDSNINDDSQKTGMSFICDHVLDKQRYVRPTSISSNEGGWGTWRVQDGIGQDTVLNPMREFLEKNIYLSLPQAWQSAISPIKVVSTKGNNSTLTTFTKGHLYVPSVAELIKEPGTSYYAEGSHIDFISSNSARSLMKGRYTNINPETYMSISEPIQSQGISPKLGDKWQKLNSSGYGAERLSFWVPQEEVNKYGIIAGSYDTEVQGLGIWLCAIIYSTRSPAFTDTTTSNLWVNMSLNGGPVSHSVTTGPRGVCPCFSI